VDGLETGFLAEKDLYLDVVRSGEDDCVGFVIECDGALLDESIMRTFKEDIAAEVGKIVAVLEREWLDLRG